MDDDPAVDYLVALVIPWTRRWWRLKRWTRAHLTGWRHA